MDIFSLFSGPPIKIRFSKRDVAKNYGDLQNQSEHESKIQSSLKTVNVSIQNEGVQMIREIERTMEESQQKKVSGRPGKGTTPQPAFHAMTTRQRKEEKTGDSSHHIVTTQEKSNQLLPSSPEQPTEVQVNLTMLQHLPLAKYVLHCLYRIKWRI